MDETAENYTWIDEYIAAVHKATCDDDLKLAAFNARGHFDKLDATAKASWMATLKDIKATAESKRKSFSEPDNESQVKARRAIIDSICEEFGQERFNKAFQDAGLRGDSDSWSIEKLNAVKQALASEPW